MSAPLRTWVPILVACLMAASGFAQSFDPGMEAMQLQNWDTAIKIYSETVKANPSDQDSWLTLGNAYLAKGDKEKAGEAFTSAFQAESSGALAFVCNGRLALLKDDASTADAQFKKAAKAGRKNVDALRAIGESFLYFTPAGAKRPNYTRAEDLLKDAVAYDSKDFKSFMALAYCYKEMPNGGLAAQNYEFAAAIAPNNPLPKMMLAITYKNAKIREKSLSYLDQTISVAPSYTPAHRMKAQTFYYENRFGMAVEAYKDMLEKCDDYTVDDQQAYANALFLTKNYEECINQVKEILKKDNSKTYLKRLLGYSEYELERYNEGLKTMENYFREVKEEKVLASDYLYYGKLLLQTGGDTLKAIEQYRKTIEIDSSKWDLYQQMAEIYYAQQDYCMAASAYSSFIDSTETPSAVDLYKLGLCQYYCKDDTLRYEHALVTFTRLSEQAPDATISWRWRAKTETKLEPDVIKDPTLIPQFGIAKDSWKKLIEVASEDAGKHQKELVEAYEYLVYYHYIRGCEEAFRATEAKLLELDPEDNTAVGLMKAVEENGMPETPEGVICE